MNEEKKCFKCGETKPLSEFYKHKRMGDGFLGKCKQCTKKDVSNNRENNIEKIREYDRIRGSMPHRILARKEYIKKPEIKERIKEYKKEYYKTEKGKNVRRNSTKKYINIYPYKAQAHQKLSYAIRSGKIIRPSNCSVCGVECIPHGHHISYLEEHWLDVIWVCIHCHIDIHNNN